MNFLRDALKAVCTVILGFALTIGVIFFAGTFLHVFMSICFTLMFIYMCVVVYTIQQNK
jgi:hypothetical protein